MDEQTVNRLRWKLHQIDDDLYDLQWALSTKSRKGSVQYQNLWAKIHDKEQEKREIEEQLKGRR